MKKITGKYFNRTLKQLRTNPNAKLAAVGGAGVGYYAGAGIGIAAFGGAIAGALPLAAVGACAAYLVTKNRQYRKEAKDARAAEKLARAALDGNIPQ